MVHSLVEPMSTEMTVFVPFYFLLTSKPWSLPIQEINPNLCLHQLPLTVLFMLCTFNKSFPEAHTSHHHPILLRGHTYPPYTLCIGICPEDFLIH